MSKKVILLISSIAVSIIGIVTGVLLYVFQNGAEDPPSNDPPIEESGVIFEDIYINQDESTVNSNITAGYKAYTSHNYTAFQTPTGKSSIDGTHANKETLYSRDRIVLSDENPEIVIKFSIKNSGENTLAAVLDIDSSEALLYSIDLFYSHNGIDFSSTHYGNKANSGLSILPEQIEDYYVKIALRGVYTASDFEGGFTWSLAEINNDHEARIGLTSYPTIEDARVAAKNNDIICLIKDVTSSSVFYIEKPLYIYADRNLTWTTAVVSGISICDYSHNGEYYNRSLYLGCDNGNKLTILSKGGYNAISVGRSSLYLAADIVCGTTNPTSNCVGVRVVGTYYLYDSLVMLGGTISGFYYGVVDMTQSPTKHNYYWGAIYNCIEGIHADIENITGAGYTLAKFSFGLNDNSFYIYDCERYCIYFDGDCTVDIVGHMWYPHHHASINISNLVLGEDEHENAFANEEDVVGCAIYASQTAIKIDGKLKCNNFTQTAIYYENDSNLTCTDNAEIELKNNSGSAGAAIYTTEAWGSSIKNAVITNNHALASGGAIYVKGGSFSLQNCTFSNNTAGDLGGAILSEAGSISLENCTLSNNFSKTYGGAIYTQGDLELIDSNLFDNSTEGDGGAVYIVGLDETRYFNINGQTEIYNNTAKTRGGAIRTGENVEINLLSGKIYNNSVMNMEAKSSGGGIYVNCGSVLNMLSGEIYNNTATGLTSYGGNVYVDKEYSDGNIAVDAAIFYFEDGLIGGDGVTNQAMSGGGIANFGLCIVVMGEIRDCVAGYGSGIYNMGTLYAMATKFTSTTTTTSIGKAIVNIGTLHLGPINLEGENMDIVIACTELNDEITAYASTNVYTELVDQNGNEKQYKLTFAQYDDNTKEITLTDDFVNYYIDNSLPIVTYYDDEEEPFEANVNNFITDNFDFVLTDDGYGLKLIAA